jgi:hypothetical protein
MKTIVIGNVFVFLIICGIVLYRGLDFRKWSSWWYGLYAFISGFMISFLRSEDNGGTNLTQGFLAGAAFLLILVGNVITHGQRKWAERYIAREEEEYQEKLDNLSESLFKGKSKKKDKAKTRLS